VVQKPAQHAGEVSKKPAEQPDDYAVPGVYFPMCQLIYRRNFLFNNLKNKALLPKKTRKAR